MQLHIHALQRQFIMTAMVSANGLVPIWHQDIWYHYGDVGLSEVSQMNQITIGSDKSCYLVQSHYICQCVFTINTIL